MHTVVWQDPHEIGAERCSLAGVTGGHTLTGTAITTVEGEPCEVRYRVEVDEGWRTRAVHVERIGAGDAAVVALSVTHGRWWVNDHEQTDLEGCADVDLEFSPATNALPIRRLALPVGEAAVLDVAWLRFPALHVERGHQRYRRLAADRYEFRTGDFVAELTVDAVGLVERYDDAWRQVATSTRQADS